MAETANIAKIAEKLSKDLFNEFLWKRTGPLNQNWSCEEPERHKAATHPTDVAFYYENPYAILRTYVNCDLKSYKSTSIKAGAVASAIESLARSLNCAEKSAHFQQLYIHEQVNAEICGLLFIYNHDGEYDKNFRLLLNDIKPKLSEIPRRSKVVVVGPDDIFWLDNVRYDIVQMRGNTLLPPQDACKFYYPHLSRKPNIQLVKASAATLEMLTSPWIILSYVHPTGKERKGYVIYYRRKGDTVREFLYLIDYLMHYQVIVEDTHVRIKMVFGADKAHVLFRKAVDEFVEKSENSADIRAKLDAVEFGPLEQVKSQFSDIQIGME